MSFLTSCRSPKRAEITANIWLNNAPIPADLCAANKDLNKYGFYRRLNNDKFEFISFCDKSANRWVAMFENDFNNLLNQYVPKNN